METTTFGLVLEVLQVISLVLVAVSMAIEALLKYSRQIQHFQTSVEKTLASNLRQVSKVNKQKIKFMCNEVYGNLMVLGRVV